MIYRHYKGDLYVVLAEATESTNARQGAKVIIYYSLGKREIHTRDLTEFFEYVDWPDGKRRMRFAAVDAKGEFT